MNIKTSLLLVLFLIFAACSHGHHHHHQGHEHPISLNNGQKWQADEVLRKNMQSLHHEFDSIKSPQDISRFQANVQSATEEIISKCQMPEEMDENYHVILEEMLAANEELSDPGTQKKALQRFEGAFQLYHQYFE